MPENSNKLSRFWQELKRRRVVHVIVVYASASFVIIELVGNVYETLNLPEWTPALTLIILFIGFPITLIFSWIFDVTPEGIEKTRPSREIPEGETAVTPNFWRIASYISFVVIVALIVLNIIPRSKRIKGAEIVTKSIAVLPFLNDSPDEEKMYFINGTMESILNNLCKIEDLRVVSRTSVEQYRNNLKPIPEIAKEMNVSYILEGSGQKLGNRILLTVQLLDGINDHHLWSRQYDREIREIRDLIDIQSEVAQLVAAEIKAIITPAEKRLIEKAPTTSLTAYDFFQKGREEHRKYWADIENKEALDKAEEFYFGALDYDPTFAQAYTGLAFVYRNKNYWKEFFSEIFLDSGLILTDIALSYDKQLPEAYIFRGRYYRAIGKTEQALKEYDKAIRYNPNNYMGYYYKAVSCCNTDVVKCISNLQKVASLDRGSLASHLNMIGMVYRNAGFSEKAQSYWQEAFKFNGDSAMYYFLLSSMEVYLNNYQKAFELYEKGRAIDSTRTFVDMMSYVLYGKFDLSASFSLFSREESLDYAQKYLERVKTHGEFGLANMHRVGYAYWLNGFKNEAENYFEKQKEFCEQQIQLGRVWAEQLFTYYDLAAIYAFRGEKEAAYENLRIFSGRKIMHQWMVWNINNDPLLNSIRDEPEFQQIVHEVEAKYQAEHERVRQRLEENDML